jgi:hypothetical protein
MSIAKAIQASLMLVVTMNYRNMAKVSGIKGILKS